MQSVAPFDSYHGRLCDNEDVECSRTFRNGEPGAEHPADSVSIDRFGERPLACDKRVLAFVMLFRSKFYREWLCMNDEIVVKYEITFKFYSIFHARMLS
jgi:hypothetical protein